MEEKVLDEEIRLTPGALMQLTFLALGSVKNSLAEHGYAEWVESE